MNNQWIMGSKLVGTVNYLCGQILGADRCEQISELMQISRYVYKQIDRQIDRQVDREIDAVISTPIIQFLSIIQINDTQINKQTGWVSRLIDRETDRYLIDKQINKQLNNNRHNIRNSTRLKKNINHPAHKFYKNSLIFLITSS